MADETYAFVRAANYREIVAASESVAWTVDEIFGDRRFDASKPMIPGSWVGTEDLDFLTADDQRTLNHIRAFSYPHLFGNYEEFIPISLNEISKQSWHDDRMRLRALARFGEEEMKHQQLFLRAEAVMEASCGYTFGRYFDPEKEKVTAFTNAVLQYPLLPRFLLLTAFEWGSQRHYVESVRDSEGDRSDPLYVDMLKYHWIEENQHTKTDVLEIARMAENMSPEELTETFDQLQGVAALVDETIVGQVEEDLRTFQTVTGRQLSKPEAATLRDRLLGTMRVIWIDVGLTHPSFKQLALELSEKGAAELGITAT
jgi:hypothetical protein